MRYDLLAFNSVGLSWRTEKWLIADKYRNLLLRFINSNCLLKALAGCTA
jgi:hypothetical protein